MIEIIAVNGVPVNAGKKILDRIGEPAALEQLAEEATELAKAALKLARVIRAAKLKRWLERLGVEYEIQEC